ncbi:MAG: hydroxyacid dehydrogenase, partial [Polynucleobacter sp. 17-46-58]
MANLPNVVILGDYEHALRRYSDWSKVDQLCRIQMYDDPLSNESLYEAIKDADIVILVRDRIPFDAALIARLPKLKLLMFTGKRNSTLDVAALKARN